MLINRNELIKAIEGHKEMVGTDNAAYRLAHDHIIDVVGMVQDKTEKICDEIEGLCKYTPCVAHCEDCIIYKAIDIVKEA